MIDYPVHGYPRLADEFEFEIQQLSLDLPDPYADWFDWFDFDSAPKDKGQAIDVVTTNGTILRGLTWAWWYTPCGRYFRVGWGQPGQFYAPPIARWKPAQ